MNAATTALIVLFVASIWAGALNALAGGSSFITLPSRMLTGSDRSREIQLAAHLTDMLNGKCGPSEPDGLRAADPTCRAIVSRLAAGDATVGELAKPFDISGSRHLAPSQGSRRGGTGRAQGRGALARLLASPRPARRSRALDQ